MSGMVLARDRWRINADHEADLGRIVEIRCPGCDLWSTLWMESGGHGIGHDGHVTPSVVCPFEHVQCRFHQFVQLAGWAQSGEQARPRIDRGGD